MIKENMDLIIEEEKQLNLIKNMQFDAVAYIYWAWAYKYI